MNTRKNQKMLAFGAIAVSALLLSGCNLLPIGETTAARSEEVEKAASSFLEEVQGGDFSDNEYTSDYLDDDSAEDLSADSTVTEITDEMMKTMDFSITASEGTEKDGEGSCDVTVTVVDLKKVLSNLDDGYTAEDVMDAIGKKKAPVKESDITLDLTYDDDWIITDASELFKLFTGPLSKLGITEATETTEATEATETSDGSYVTEQSMTISFAFGEYAGVYTGDIKNSLPDGYGTFNSYESSGTTWYYQGDWVGGHMEGQGLTYWDNGWTEEGTYKNDYLNGSGMEYGSDYLVYEGNYTDNEYDGYGTYYDCNGEIVFAGNWSMGFIVETAEERAARVQPFKDSCSPMSAADMYTACDTSAAAHVTFSGKILQVYTFDTGKDFYCDFLIYVDGVEAKESIVQVFYRLTSGEAKVTEGQTVTVWGSTQYVADYTAEDNTAMSVPNIEARSVE